METYIDSFDNRVTRVEAGPGLVTFSSDFLIRDSGQPEATPEDAPLTPVTKLPVDVLRFLLPSRYCDSDVVGDFAWSQFGSETGSGAGLVQPSAISSTATSVSTISAPIRAAPPPTGFARG